MANEELEKKWKEEAEALYPRTGDEREDMVVGFMRTSYRDACRTRQGQIDSLTSERDHLHKAIISEMTDGKEQTLTYSKYIEIINRKPPQSSLD